MDSHLSIRRVQVVVFLVSAALIAYEILLFKLFAIRYWHHFAYLIVSIALLGFGASGTFIFLFRRWLKRHFRAVLYLAPFLMVISIWGNIFLGRLIAFNPLMFIWQPREALGLLALSLAILIPFFIGAVCVGLSLSVHTGEIHRIYFANLAGSGVGSLPVLLTFFHLGPHEIILIISLITLCATFAVGGSRGRTIISAIALIATVPLYLILLHGRPVGMSEFKDLSIARTQMGARIEAEVFGPLGLVTVLDSPAYHYLPDLSLNCPFDLPGQKGLFLNGDAAGAINVASGDMRFMEWRTTSLPYRLLDRPSVLIIGGGGGTEILNARHHGAKEISVVEMNREVIHLMQGRYRAFSGDIYGPERSRIFTEDGRGYLERTQQRFDLIQMSLLESMESSSAGVFSLNENYLFTTEALRTALGRLTPGGILSISRWIKNPPRDSIKILATAISALGPRDAAGSIVMIRSWQTATLLVKRGPFTPGEIETVKEFCRGRLFDLCYYPGIREGETNIVNRLDESYFFTAATRLLAGEGEHFYEEYPFYVRPATDDRPFFAHTFKTAVLKKYLIPYGRVSIPLIDWGYILVWTALGILVLLSLLLILVPIGIAGGAARGRFPVFIYFGSLGLAYMFLEMSFLQQFIRYLYDPVFSAAVVIGSFLIYSGIGSLIAGRIGMDARRQVPVAVLWIAAVAIVYLLADPLLQGILFSLPLGARMVICSLLIAPLALPMGAPFPAGLSRLTGEDEPLIPWAWGINGFLSVIGASVAVLVAIGWGFRSVVLAALALYILAAGVYWGWFRRGFAPTRR
ncbi:MAG: hypothetical protein Q7J01_07765 [Syntrophales bacterium]|nr:hypothetical protein [Syntrophales bacterium]